MMLPWLTLLAAPVFAGNDACRPCHAALTERYQRTPMARTSGAVVQLPAPLESREALRWFVGSGSRGQSYLWSRAGRLFQAPVGWYASPPHWGPSPGYEGREDDWSRPIDRTCLDCHASQVSPVRGQLNLYGDPPFRQSGVACERCHGPGSEHVKNRAPMVNPAKLDAERRADVCQQCHLMGEARIERAGRAFANFRAGERLADYVTYFVFDGPAALKVTSHVEKLAQSKCRPLECTSCHTIHGEIKNTCQGCHQQPHTREACLGCHMPKAPAVDAAHGVFTDHAIPRVPVRTITAQPWKLKAFGARAASARDEALAYLQLYQRTGDDRQKKAAERLLGGRIVLEPQR